MSYLHIPNLYKDQTILLFRRCFALEKVHGTSARVAYRDDRLHLSPGSESAVRFAGLFDQARLLEAFRAMGHHTVTVYGEAYGGKQLGQSWRYGPDLRFVAFDVKVGDLWLGVLSAHQLVVDSLKLEFVHFADVPTDLEALDAERDAPSEQARRNGVEGDQPREGVVLRPPLEVRLNNDERIIAKHKRAEERETRTERPVVDPAKLAVLADAERIAEEWVTPTRLQHVLDKIAPPHGMGQTRAVIAAMLEDVLREGAGEIVESPEAKRAIGTHTAKLFKAHVGRGSL